MLGPDHAPASCKMKPKSFVLARSTLRTAWLVAIFPSTIFAASFTATPIADAYVATGPAGELKDNNYGGGGALAVSTGTAPNGEFQSVLRFDTAGIRNSLDATFGAGAWSIDAISLRLSSSPHSNAIYNEIAPGLFSVSLMQNNSWVEGSGNASAPGATGITYNSLQAVYINPGADRALGTLGFTGGSSGVNNYGLNLDPALISDIQNGSQLSLRLSAADDSLSYLFSSRAATSSDNRPQLIVSAVPEPGTIAIFGLGAIALFVAQRRRAKFAGTP